jgi:hypothetical protein
VLVAAQTSALILRQTTLADARAEQENEWADADAERVQEDAIAAITAAQDQARAALTAAIAQANADFVQAQFIDPESYGTGLPQIAELPRFKELPVGQGTADYGAAPSADYGFGLGWGAYFASALTGMVGAAYVNGSHAVHMGVSSSPLIIGTLQGGSFTPGFSVSMPIESYSASSESSYFRWQMQHQIGSGDDAARMGGNHLRERVQRDYGGVNTLGSPWSPLDYGMPLGGSTSANGLLVQMQFGASPGAASVGTSQTPINQIGPQSTRDFMGEVSIGDGQDSTLNPQPDGYSQTLDAAKNGISNEFTDSSTLVTWQVAAHAGVQAPPPPIAGVNVTNPAPQPQFVHPAVGAPISQADSDANQLLGWGGNLTRDKIEQLERDGYATRIVDTYTIRIPIGFDWTRVVTVTEERPFWWWDDKVKYKVDSDTSERTASENQARAREVSILDLDDGQFALLLQGIAEGMRQRAVDAGLSPQDPELEQAIQAKLDAMEMLRAQARGTPIPAELFLDVAGQPGSGITRAPDDPQYNMLERAFYGFEDVWVLRTHTDEGPLAYVFVGQRRAEHELVGEGISTSYHKEYVLKEIVSGTASDLAAAQGYYMQKVQDRLSLLEGGLTFALHLVPGGAALDYASQGNWKEAGFALAADIAGLFTGPLAKFAHGKKFFTVAKAIKGTGVAIEGGLVLRGASQALEALLAGDGVGFAAAAGDTVLRLLYLGRTINTPLGTATPPAAGVAPVNSGSKKPEWLRRLDEGNAFNRDHSPRYPHKEVYVDCAGGGYKRLDSYNPTSGEIVSRKFTQLRNIQESTGLDYLNELARKYAPGTRIANVPSSGLEVPVQVGPIPQSFLDAASRLGILIRDVSGRVY